MTTLKLQRKISNEIIELNKLKGISEEQLIETTKAHLISNSVPVELRDHMTYLNIQRTNFGIIINMQFKN